MQLVLGDFDSNDGAYYLKRRHQVVITQSLEEFIDMLLKGDWGSGILWHEVMHGVFKKRRDLGIENGVFDLALQAGKSKAHYGTYGSHIRLEEIYNHFNERIWELRNSDSMSAKELMKEFYELTPMWDVWSHGEGWMREKKNLFRESLWAKLNPLRAAIARYENKFFQKSSIDLIDDDTLLFTAPGPYYAYFYLNPENRALLKSKKLDLKNFVKSKLDEASRFLEEAEDHLDQLREDVLAQKEALLSLSETDPVRCQSILLRLYQKHFFFLKKHLNGRQVAAP